MSRAGLLEPRRQFMTGLALVIFVFLALTVIRVLSPDDMGKRDQPRVGSYITDVVQNGNWLSPRDAFGGMGSKPPMHPWLAAVAAHAIGGVARPAWLFPSVLSVLILCLVLYVAGQRWLGWEAGLLAAVTFLLCQISPKMIGIVRTDALFACLVLLNGLAALNIWERGKGWPLFWTIAIVNTLTKGPLGVLLGLSGLLALVWERRRGHPSPFGRAMLPGLLIWIVVSLGWLLSAWWAYGDEVIHEMIGRELLGHAVVGDGGEPPFQRFYLAPFYLLSRYAPWSFFTIAAVIRVFRRPAADDTRRRFDRFMVCWVLSGLVIFSLAGHQRPDLLFPLVAPAAFLAGSQLVRLSWLRGPRRAFAGACIMAATLVPVLGLFYAYHYPDDPLVRFTTAAGRTADEIRDTVGVDFPLVYAGAPLTLQIEMGIWKQNANQEVACALYRREEPVYFVVPSAEALVESCGDREVETWVFHDRVGEREGTSYAVVGNRERLEWHDPILGWVAPFTVLYRGVRPAAGASYYLDKAGTLRGGGQFAVDPGGGAITVTNTADRPAALRLELRQGERRWREDHLLPPRGELFLAWPEGT